MLFGMLIIALLGMYASYRAGYDDGWYDRKHDFWAYYKKEK